MTLRAKTVGRVGHPIQKVNIMSTFPVELAYSLIKNYVSNLKLLPVKLYEEKNNLGTPFD